jgi:type IV secretion system protein VirB3
MSVPSETIYKGATRPAMKLGVPLVPFVVLFGGGMLAIIWIGPLLTWWVVPVVVAIAAPALGCMRFVTSKDDQRFRQMFLLGRLLWGDRNRHFWKARSYTPYCHQGTRDVAHQ